MDASYRLSLNAGQNYFRIKLPSSIKTFVLSFFKWLIKDRFYSIVIKSFISCVY